MAARSLVVAASGLVKSGPAHLGAVVLKGGSAAASVVVYDNTAGSGDKLVELVCAAGDSVVFTPAVPVAASRGLYVALSGTGASATVVWG